MPTKSEVEGAVNQVAADLYPRRARLSDRDLDLVVLDMERHPEDWGCCAGPNWDAKHLKTELCQRLWNTPVHPSQVPPAWVGLPFKVLRDLLVMQWTPVKLMGYRAGDPDWQLLAEADAEALEWLAACACNRRHRSTDWQEWLDDPFTWRFRHVPREAWPRLREFVGARESLNNNSNQNHDT